MKHNLQVGEFEPKGLVRHVDHLGNRLDVVVGLHPEVLEQFSDPKLDLQFSEPPADAHSWPVAERPDGERVDALLVLNPSLRDELVYWFEGRI